MSSYKPKSKAQEPLDYVLSVFALMMTSIVWLIIFTFPDFYFINPLDATSFIRKVTLSLSTLGWIIQGTVPPLLILLYASGMRRAINWLWAGALFWPVSLLISQVTNYVDNQYWYGDYLTDYPILGFTDIALPLILMYLWTRLRVLPRD
jgi:hypothetical protein